MTYLATTTELLYHKKMNIRTIAQRYTINNEAQDLLGEGGMGQVFRAQDNQTGEQVAIKQLKTTLSADAPELVARFIREGEALRQLNHPNIVQMLTAVQENGQHYLVMEYISGGSIAEHLHLRQLPLRQLVNIALDVADALTRAHRLGIIHRDIKPANILLAEDGTVKLADFGVAHISNDDGMTGITNPQALIGTLAYLSPEMCLNEPASVASDVWAFGVTLYEMVTGTRPFVGDAPAATLMAIMSQSVPDIAQLRPDAPEALQDLTYRMLAKNVSERIPSVRLVGAELEALAHQLVDKAPLADQTQLYAPATQVFPQRRQPIARPFRSETPSPQSKLYALPAQATPFIGRVEPLRDLRQLVQEDQRLITILGMGGMGKSRLSIELAQQLAPQFADGVAFIPLAPLTKADEIPDALIQTLSLKVLGGTPLEQIKGYLANKQCLLIFDNFEHVIEGASLIGDLLSHAPQVHILVTSRARLGLKAEVLYEIGQMAWEATAENPTESEAVQLFLAYARRVQPNYELEEEELTAVQEIYHLVGGAPLGLELAAAWVRMLSPSEIAEELAEDRDMLETSVSDMPDRHRSLRAVFDYSWRLLPEKERQVFMRLSLFRGGFTRQAAKAVAGANLRLLMALADQSFIKRTPDGRYAVHELMRQFGAELLSENRLLAQETRAAHGQYYAGYYHQLHRDLITGKKSSSEVQKEAHLEQENARMAWGWARAHEAIEALGQLVSPQPTLYSIQTRQNLGETFGWLLAQADSPQKWVALGRLGVGMVLFMSRGQGKHEEAYALTLRIYNHLRDCPQTTAVQFARTEILATLALLANKDAPKNVELVAEGLALARSLGDIQHEIAFLQTQGLALRDESPREAVQLLQQAITKAQLIEDKSGIGRIHFMLGQVYIRQQDYSTAVSHFEQNLQYSTANQDVVFRFYGLYSLWATYFLLENYAQMWTYLYTIGEELGGIANRWPEAILFWFGPLTLAGMGLMVAQHDPATAVAFLNIVNQPRYNQMEMLGPLLPRIHTLLSELEGELDTAVYAQAIAQTEQMPLPQLLQQGLGFLEKIRAEMTHTA